ncbi:twin-arginine translocase TatA/TatE family subunit [Salinibaculum rarum]|uniref:twin-arginine translocase TatA/TatE family subunit n=1 Tax=Salinibaculum rarum TaxID=3058903 RepID=UPI002660499C|nr:twin-arginine translocase TatA/TatE family subunit [Salinibaculum sp. KK48]
MVETMVPLFGPVPGGMEMVVILLIAVLLFGANKIPKLARSTGEAMGEFKKGRQEVEQELEDLQESEAEGSSEESTADSASDEDIEYMDTDSIDSETTDN